MKILHTSDWHLGIDYHRHSFTEDQRYALRQYYEIIQREAVDVVFICGDIYDTTVLEALKIPKEFDEQLYNLAITISK